MAQFLGGIIVAMNRVLNNYGVTMIVFTLLIKLLVFPLNYKSRKSMRRMSLVQPQVQKLQKKYENDKEKLNQKMAELYRKEGVSPTSGCLPMLISMVILYIMWAGMRWVANYQIAYQAVEMILNNSVEYQYESFLWIKNIWVADSPFHPIIIQQSDLVSIPTDTWKYIVDSFLTPDELNALVQIPSLLNAEGVLSLDANNVYALLSALPGYAAEVAPAMDPINLLITRVIVYAKCNGFFILPILSAVTQFIMTATQPNAGNENASASTGNFMKYFFPIFSLFICSSFNAMFALYWAISNIFGWLETIILNYIFEKKDREEKTATKIEEGSIK